MKRYMIVFAALLAAVSCKVENPLAAGDAELPCGGERLTFTAEIEASRTVLGSDWSVTWAEGDEVSILWRGGRTVAPAVIADGKVTFSASVEDAEGYFALYPSTVPASVGSDGRLTFTLPPQQDGTFAGCAVIASYTTREALDFGRFRSAVGLVRFNIGDGGISRVSFSSAGDVPVSGTVSVSPSFERFETAPAAGSIDVAVSGKGTYFMAVLPGLSLPGLDFRLGTQNAWKGSASSSTPAVIGAGDVLCINTPLDEKMVSEGDVVVGDVETLRTLLSGSASDIDGKTLLVKPGTYQLGLALDYAAPVSFAIKGGEGTVFTGDDACLTVDSGNVSLTLDGITFSGCTHNGEGGALCLKAGDYRINNCTFTDNQTTSSTADRCGGAVYVGGTASADISGCLFCGNKVKITGGGALAFFSAATSSVRNCTFRNNNPEKIGNGGAILIKHSDCTLYLADCSFDGNACATNGPDIFGSRARALLAWNCTFTGGINASPGNLGAIRINHPGFFGNCTMAMGTVGEANGVLAFGLSSGDTAASNHIFNNLILCDQGSSLGTASATAKRGVTTYGHNVWFQAPNLTLTDKGAASDKTGVKTSDLFSSTVLSGAGVLEWNGPAVVEGFACATPEEASSALNAYTFGGAAFYDWLVREGIFDKDAAGNGRGTAWWPGAWQK
ncbi:MAG: hypothetical protein IJS62_05590 [Bacteroidales bacterium]|nr:hypothetical protein [Bacteroidales bacterium]